MPYPPKVVLQSTKGYRMELDSMVEEFLRDGVKFVAVVGQDCEKLEAVSYTHLTLPTICSV